MKTLILPVMLLLSMNGLTSSFMNIVNHSNSPVTAIWQAGGCAMYANDPEGDMQFTVCRHAVIQSGYQTKYSFSFLKFDRSVKIWGANGGERMGYCNSMDDETLTIEGTDRDNQEVNGC